MFITWRLIKWFPFIKLIFGGNIWATLYMDINNLKHFNLKYRDLSKEPFIKVNNALDISTPQDHPTKQTNEDKRELALWKDYRNGQGGLQSSLEFPLNCPLTKTTFLEYTKAFILFNQKPTYSFKLGCWRWCKVSGANLWHMWKHLFEKKKKKKKGLFFTWIKCLQFSNECVLCEISCFSMTWK